MNQENSNHKELRIINLKEANAKAICFLLIIFVVYAVPYTLIWYNSFSKEFFKASIIWMDYYPIWSTPLIFILVPLLGIVVHELIHGVFWAIFAKRGWKSIKFGYLKETATPYCHCNEPLLVWQYSIGTIMPFVALGLLPAIWACATGNVLLFVFAVIFSATAVGDFMILDMVRKEKSNTYVQDHPSEAGYYSVTNKI